MFFKPISQREICSTKYSLSQAPREMREGECEGMKTRGEWGREKEGKKRSL